jgi:NADH-quinone oxidoreductase B subunit
MMNIKYEPLWVLVAKKVRTWARLNSIWAVHFNSGSCNGCDIEILATLTPRYDVERFGIKLEGSPRHADVLIVTGPVTRQARERLLRTYEQMPEPKYVISVGSCSISGGVFDGCYNVGGAVDEVIPVDVFIPGCPPRPEAVVDGIIQLLAHLKEGKLPRSVRKDDEEKVAG